MNVLGTKTVLNEGSQSMFLLRNKKKNLRISHNNSHALELRMSTYLDRKLKSVVKVKKYTFRGANPAISTQWFHILKEGISPLFNFPFVKMVGNVAVHAGTRGF